MSLTEKKMIDRKGGFELKDLRDEKVHMVCFKGAEFHGVDMRDTSLAHVNFVNSSWEHIYLSNVHINMAQMGGTIFENIKRPEARESQLTEEPGTAGWVNVEPVIFKNSDLRSAIFEDCEFFDVDIRNCNIDGLKINGIFIKDLIGRYNKE